MDKCFAGPISGLNTVIVKEVVAFSLLKHYASHLLGLGRPC